MKKITYFILAFALYYNAAFGQENLRNEEELKLQRVLQDNFNHSIVKVHEIKAFTIQVIPTKNSYRFQTSDSLVYKIFGNVDSLFKKVNFDIFQQGKSKHNLILPVGIAVVNIEDKETKGAIKRTDLLLKAIGDMFDLKEENSRYNSIFLRPFFILVDVAQK